MPIIGSNPKRLLLVVLISLVNGIAGGSIKLLNSQKKNANGSKEDQLIQVADVHVHLDQAWPLADCTRGRYLNKKNTINNEASKWHCPMKTCLAK